MDNLVIIVGAGASYDCVDRNIQASSYDSNYQPPLTSELFDFRFNEIITKYTRVSEASEEIRVKLDSKRISVESYLETLGVQSLNNKNSKLLYRQIPLYLRDLLLQVSIHYISGNNPTKYSTLIRTLDNSNYKKITIITLNYDLLIEKAIERTLGKINSMDDYLHIDGKWSLIKLHGSVDWGQKILNLPPSNSKFIERINFFPYDLELQNQINKLVFPQDFRDDLSQPFYPVLAVPTQGKLHVCPAKHYLEAENALKAETDLLVIGYSAIDGSILKLIKNIPKIGNFLVVNKDEYTTQAYDRLSEASVAISSFDNKFEDYLFKDGFSVFVADHLDEFIETGKVAKTKIQIL